METALANPTIIVNGIVTGIVPNSVTYTEGLGEQNQRTQSSGGGATQVIYSQNVESNISMVKFSVYPTIQGGAGGSTNALDLLRGWKENTNNNVIQITAPNFQRSFTSAALTTNYEVALGADTTIEVEFMANASV
jgi:hypothetical protein